MARKVKHKIMSAYSFIAVHAWLFITDQRLTKGCFMHTLTYIMSAYSFIAVHACLCINGSTADQGLHLISQSDLVIFVTSAERPITETEGKLLSYISEWGKKVVKRASERGIEAFTGILTRISTINPKPLR